MMILRNFFVGLLLCLVLFFISAVKNSFAETSETEVAMIHPDQVIDKEISEVSEYDLRQIHCMAENLYFEARGEPTLGQIAVNNVVMNRVNDPQKRFGNNPCEVISQITFNKNKKKVCQFSWKCEGNKKIKNHEKFLVLKTLSQYTYFGAFDDVTEGSKFYHATYVNPRWNLKKVTKIGQHVFYREPDKL